jgi:methylenetetrahydrofolate reductase (NADH)
MHIRDIFQQHKITFSFEFFPPRNIKAAQDLYVTIKELNILKPAFVSITYGAGGTTRELTHDLVVKLSNENDIPVVSHLTCSGSTKDEIDSILKRYEGCGIENIMALRGDPPSGMGSFVPETNGFRYATELVEFIKSTYPNMGIGVAGYSEGHPETPNRLKEIEFLKAKVDAGAEYICTQLFYDNHDFYDFRERCIVSGINVPIIAGIMPITSFKNMKRMSDLALGAHVPGKLLKALVRTTTQKQVENVGTHWASEQVRDLIDNGVKGIHFYTLNRSSATLKIYENMGVTSSDAFENQNILY